MAYANITNHLIGFHILFALTCVATGVAAMLSKKCCGRHPRFGTIYFCSLGLVWLTASACLGPLVAGLRTLLSRLRGIGLRVTGVRGETDSLERLAPVSHLRHGRLVHHSLDGFLCGQWIAAPGMGSAPSHRLLAAPDGHGCPAHRPSSMAATQVGSIIEGGNLVVLDHRPHVGSRAPDRRSTSPWTRSGARTNAVKTVRAM